MKNLWQKEETNTHIYKIKRLVKKAVNSDNFSCGNGAGNYVLLTAR